MRFKQKTFVFVGVLTCMVFPAYAEERRQLGAHVHGHGHLNIAIEDKTVSIELEVPGADIVGFEHEASTPKQKAALEKAKAKLAAGLSLFTPAAAANCTQKSAKVSIEAEHGDEHEHHAEGGKPGAKEEEEGHHSLRVSCRICLRVRVASSPCIHDIRLFQGVSQCAGA